MSDLLSTDTITKAISEYISAELDKVFEEELDKATERIRQRQAQIVSGVALNIMRQFEIGRAGEIITIRVEDKRS